MFGCSNCEDTRCLSCVDGDAEDAAADALEEMRCGVIIVEFWAMMAGALPFGCYPYDGVAYIGAGESWGVESSHEKIKREAWTAEYRARPRLDGDQ